ncbi:MAG: hypothetical protein EXS13_14705 [Planctomycetes bacterium]|nr:hypothetical protein [Planctomycetota bacterium]
MHLLRGALLFGTLTASATAASAAHDADTVQAAIAKGVAYLVAHQEADGSFGAPRNIMLSETFATVHTYEAWTFATTGLVAMALLDCGATPEAKSALDRAVDWLIAAPQPVRVSEWDCDHVWGDVYGLQGIAHLLRNPRFDRDARRPKLIAVGKRLLRDLEQWQSPLGGWGYYEGEAISKPNSWSTQFTTAAGVIAMQDAKLAGLPVDEAHFAKALRAVKHCRLPNGAYTYSVDAVSSAAGLEDINQVKGSLGRMQVGNVALYRSGEVDGRAVRSGLEQFFEHHQFLAVARGKPIPHESWYAVAAYFFLFGHFYAAEAIELLPAEQRPKFARQLEAKLLDVQEADGAFWDFHISTYTRAYGTAFGVMSLARVARATSPRFAAGG